MKICFEIYYFDDSEYDFKVEFPKSGSIIQLDENCTQNDVGIFIGSLLGFNDLDLNSEFIDALHKEDGIALGGGILFEKGGVAIEPSCCADLGNWKEILDGLPKCESGWMGHDPMPKFEFEGETITLWSDDPSVEKVYSIEFNQTDVNHMMISVQNDLSDFLEKVEIWASSFYKEAPDKLVDGIRDYFHLTGS